MNPQYSRFILWFRMQSLRDDAIGKFVRELHQDPEVLSCSMYSGINTYLRHTDTALALLPLWQTATAEFDQYHKRQFSTMPCLVCRGALETLPREDITVMWTYMAGLENHTLGFLHKPCFMRIDDHDLGCETLDRLLNPVHGYRQPLGMKWWEALVRLWPPTHKLRSKPLVVEARLEKLRTLSARFNVLKRDQYRCRLCGVAARDGDHVRLEVDHIVARSKGGTDDEINLWTLCFACNRGKGTKDL